MEIYSSDGKYVPVLSIQIIESLDYLSAMVRITTSTPLYGSEYQIPQVYEGKPMKFTVFMSNFNENVFVSYLYPTHFFAMHKNLFAGFTGYSTVENLAKSLGFSYTGPKSLRTYWDLPKTSLHKILTLLTKFASIEGGGAPHFYINLDGCFQCVDYKYSVEKMSPVLLVATTQGSKYSTEWFSQIPGDFRFVKFFPDGTEVENYTVKPNTLFSQVSCYFSTRDAANTINQAYSNQFYEYYYTTTVADVTLAYSGMYGIGTAVKLDTSGDTMVVRSRTTTFSGENPTQQLQLVSGLK